MITFQADGNLQGDRFHAELLFDFVNDAGGVCPFGIDGAVRVIVDAGLRQYPTIYPAAGTNSSGVPMTFDQLVAITGGQVGEFTVAGDGEEETE